MPVTVGPSTLTINHDRQFLVCQPDATMSVHDHVGFYALDTRFVSGYAVLINGRKPVLIDAVTVNHFAARHEFMTPELPLGVGFGSTREEVIPERSIGFRLERTWTDDRRWFAVHLARPRRRRHRRGDHL